MKFIILKIFRSVVLKRKKKGKKETHQNHSWNWLITQILGLIPKDSDSVGLTRC